MDSNTINIPVFKALKTLLELPPRFVRKAPSSSSLSNPQPKVSSVHPQQFGNTNQPSYLPSTYQIPDYSPRPQLLPEQPHSSGVASSAFFPSGFPREISAGSTFPSLNNPEPFTNGNPKPFRPNFPNGLSSRSLAANLTSQPSQFNFNNGQSSRTLNDQAGFSNCANGQFSDFRSSNSRVCMFSGPRSFNNSVLPNVPVSPLIPFSPFVNPSATNVTNPGSNNGLHQHSSCNNNWSFNASGHDLGYSFQNPNPFSTWNSSSMNFSSRFQFTSPQLDRGGNVLPTTSRSEVHRQAPQSIIDVTPRPSSPLHILHHSEVSGQANYARDLQVNNHRQLPEQRSMRSNHDLWNFLYTRFSADDPHDDSVELARRLQFEEVIQAAQSGIRLNRNAMRILFEPVSSQARGVPITQLKTFPVHTIDRDTLAQRSKKLGSLHCTICLEEWKLKERVLKLPCSHFFHKHCIEKWLRGNHKCPLDNLSLLEMEKASAANSRGITH